MTPDGWSETTVEQVAQIAIGKTPARKERSFWDTAKTTQNRWATISDMKNKYIDDTCEYISDIGAKIANARLVPTGTLLMSFKLSLGRVAITSQPMYTNEAIAAFYPNCHATTEYLYYLLPTLALQESSDRAVKGRTLNKAKLRALKLSLPPLAEQRRIAAILSSVDDAIERTQAVIDQVQVVKRGLMQELLARGLPGRHRHDVGKLPRGWSIKNVGELGRVVTGSTPRTENDTFWNGTVAFVTPVDLGNTRNIGVTARYVTEEGLAHVRVIPPGAVMVTCIGSIGKIGIATTRCCTNQQINTIIPDSSIILAEYLYYAMCFSSDQLAGLAGKTAVPIVSKSEFLALRLPVPPVAEQKDIARVLTSIDQSIELNRAWRARLVQSKLALMSALLSGELRVAVKVGTP